MTLEEAKIQLGELRHIYRAIKRLEEKISMLELEIINGGGVKFAFSSRNQNPKTNADRIASMLDLKEYYIELKKEYYAKTKIIEKKIEKINKQFYKNILRNYYIEGLTLEKISVSYNYTYRRTIWYFRQAVLEYAKEEGTKQEWG